MHTYLNKQARLIVLLLLAGITLWPGCGKDSGTDGPECNISGVTFSYNANIKGIIDRNCTSCHYPNSTVAGIVGDFTTYEGMKSHLDEGHVRERVVIDKDMPQSGGSMTQAERDSINCWILAGYPKN